MYKHFRFLLCLCCFSFTFYEVSLCAEVCDVLVVLDTSGSLLSYYDEINGEVLKEISTQYLRKGDVFHLISFDTSPRLELSQLLETEADFSNIVYKFSLLYPLAKTSNFSYALDFLENYISLLPLSHSKKLIFISDGFFTYSESDVGYNQETFEKKLNDFSVYLSKIGKIQTYYIKLPISSNQIVKDLKNDVSFFVNTSFEMAEIMAYPLISKLPMSLKEYLSFYDIDRTVSKSKNEASNLFSASFKNTEQNESRGSEDVDDTEIAIGKENAESLDEKPAKIKKTVVRNEVAKINYELTKIETEPNVNLVIEENVEGIDKAVQFRTIYIFFIALVLLGLIIFSISFIFLLVMKKRKNKLSNEGFSNLEDSLVFQEESVNLKHKTTEDFQDKDIESKNEVLLSSAQEYLDVENDIASFKNLDVKNDKDVENDKLNFSKTYVQETSKILTKEEKILLNVKTFETKSNTEYSQSLFTLSAETKKAFANGNAIENMVSLLNASYIDAGDVFYRFKHSLYTKRYVKNIDITKKNYLEMFVVNQRRSIGMRNIHFLTLNKTFYLGGGKRDDFLIFLVPIPRKLASICYDGKEIIFNILKPKYFPFEKENVIRDPIDRFFIITSDKGYSIHFMFRLYEKEAFSSNTILSK